MSKQTKMHRIALNRQWDDIAEEMGLITNSVEYHKQARIFKSANLYVTDALEAMQDSSLDGDNNGR